MFRCIQSRLLLFSTPPEWQTALCRDRPARVYYSFPMRLGIAQPMEKARKEKLVAEECLNGVRFSPRFAMTTFLPSEYETLPPSTSNLIVSAPPSSARRVCYALN